MPIVWTMPDGSLQVTTIVDAVVERERRPGEPTAEVVRRLAPLIQAKSPGFAGGIPTLVASKDIPARDNERHKWKLQGDKIVVDHTKPDRPNPRQTLLDQIDSAKDINELKTVLKRVLA